MDGTSAVLDGTRTMMDGTRTVKDATRFVLDGTLVVFASALRRISYAERSPFFFIASTQYFLQRLMVLLKIGEVVVHATFNGVEADVR